MTELNMLKKQPPWWKYVNWPFVVAATLFIILMSAIAIYGHHIGSTMELEDNYIFGRAAGTEYATDQLGNRYTVRHIEYNGKTITCFYDKYFQGCINE